MSTNNKSQKPIFKLVVTPKGIFMEAPRPKQNTVIIIALVLLLSITLIIVTNERGLRSKGLELVVSVIEAIVTFFQR